MRMTKLFANTPRRLSWPIGRPGTQSCSIFTPLVLPFAATISAHPWVHQNQRAPAHVGSLACHETREGAQPLTHCAAIITIAVRVEALIVPSLALRDQTVSLRALTGADLSLRPLVPCLAKKHSTSNCWFKGNYLCSELSE